MNYFCLAQVVAGLLLLDPLASGQSLADAARAEREKKAKVQGAKAAKVLTNDDLPERPQEQGSSAGSSSPECNGASAIAVLRTLNTAQITYASTYQERGFSQGLNQIGPTGPGASPNMQRADLVDAALAGLSQGGNDTGFLKDGYRFAYNAGSPDRTGRMQTYTLSARPIRYGQTGRLSFFADQTTIIRGTEQDRAATVSDPPLARYPRCEPGASRPQPGAAQSASASDKSKLLISTEIAPGVSVGLEYRKDPVSEADRQSRIQALQHLVSVAEKAIAENCTGGRRSPACDYGERTRKNALQEIERLQKMGPLPR